jgi:hypothetical protein
MLSKMVEKFLRFLTLHQITNQIQSFIYANLLKSWIRNIVEFLKQKTCKTGNNASFKNDFIEIRLKFGEKRYQNYNFDDKLSWEFSIVGYEISKVRKDLKTKEIDYRIFLALRGTTIHYLIQKRYTMDYFLLLNVESFL